jgi:hypothetical protein
MMLGSNENRFEDIQRVADGKARIQELYTNDAHNPLMESLPDEASF